MDQSTQYLLKRENAYIDIYFSKYDIQTNRILTTRNASINLQSFVKDIAENPDLLLDEDRKCSDVYTDLKSNAAISINRYEKANLKIYSKKIYQQKLEKYLSKQEEAELHTLKAKFLKIDNECSNECFFL